MNKEQKYEYLPGLIKKTRLSHIHAEKRLLALDTLTKHATLYFACWTSVLTLLTLFIASRALTLLSIIAAFITTLCTLYASSQNYGLRAAQMKQSYLDLQSLWLEFDNLDQENKKEKAKFADEAGMQYINILVRTENHIQVDFDNRYEKDLDQELCERVKYCSVRLCIYVLPILLSLFIILPSIYS